MQLREWFNLTGTPVKEAAEICGVSPSGMSNYICKERIPPLIVAYKIVSMTRGRVSYEDLLREEDLHGIRTSNNSRKKHH